MGSEKRDKTLIGAAALAILAVEFGLAWYYSHQVTLSEQRCLQNGDTPVITAGRTDVTCQKTAVGRAP